jgi:hypothetical protein
MWAVFEKEGVRRGGCCERFFGDFEGIWVGFFIS